LEEGREVFAVPGEITSALSGGTNALIRLGATPLLAAADVLGSFGLDPAAPDLVDPEGEEALVLAQLGERPASADELARRTELDPGRLAAVLTSLELRGLVTTDDGVYRSSIRA
jgi:DNA processing protein